MNIVQGPKIIDAAMMQFAPEKILALGGGGGLKSSRTQLKSTE